MKHSIRNEIDQQTVTAMKVVKIIGFTILGISLVILFGFVVMWLWNALMPEIFNTKEITYFQGIGLLILGRILFGGFGSSSSSSKGNKDTVKGVIGAEIQAEIRKGIEEEYLKKNPEVNNDSVKDEDALYEQWWDKEGEKLFEDYLDQKEN